MCILILQWKWQVFLSSLHLVNMMIFHAQENIPNKSIYIFFQFSLIDLIKNCFFILLSCRYIRKILHTFTPTSFQQEDDALSRTLSACSQLKHIFSPLNRVLFIIYERNMTQYLVVGNVIIIFILTLWQSKFHSMICREGR